MSRCCGPPETIAILYTITPLTLLHSKDADSEQQLEAVITQADIREVFRVDTPQIHLSPHQRRRQSVP